MVSIYLDVASLILARQSRNMARKLQEAKGPVRLVEFAGDDHHLNTAAVRTTLLTEAETFIKAAIGGAQ